MFENVKLRERERQSDESEKDLTGYIQFSEQRGNIGYLRERRAETKRIVGSFTRAVVQKEVIQRKQARHRQRQNKPENEKEPED